MNVNLIAIYDRGNLVKERIHLVATADVDLSYSLVMDTFFTEETKIKALQRSCFWFSPKSVKANDNIILYTTTGLGKTENRDDGKVYHFIYRGLTIPLYADQNTCAVVFDIKTWKTVK